MLSAQQPYMATGYLIEQCKYRTFPALQKVLLNNVALESAKKISQQLRTWNWGKGLGTVLWNFCQERRKSHLCLELPQKPKDEQDNKASKESTWLLEGAGELWALLHMDSILPLSKIFHGWVLNSNLEITWKFLHTHEYIYLSHLHIITCICGYVCASYFSKYSMINMERILYLELVRVPLTTWWHYKALYSSISSFDENCHTYLKGLLWDSKCRYMKVLCKEHDWTCNGW